MSEEPFLSEVMLNAGDVKSSDVTGYFEPSSIVPEGKLGVYIPVNRKPDEPTIAQQLKSLRAENEEIRQNLNLLRGEVVMLKFYRASNLLIQRVRALEDELIRKNFFEQ